MSPTCDTTTPSPRSRGTWPGSSASYPASSSAARPTSNGTTRRTGCRVITAWFSGRGTTRRSAGTNTDMTYGTSNRSGVLGRILGFVLVIWLIIGALAAWQRDYYGSAKSNCASVGTITL